MSITQTLVLGVCAESAARLPSAFAPCSPPQANRSPPHGSYTAQPRHGAWLMASSCEGHNVRPWGHGIAHWHCSSRALVRWALNKQGPLCIPLVPPSMRGHLLCAQALGGQKTRLFQQTNSFGAKMAKEHLLLACTRCAVLQHLHHSLAWPHGMALPHSITSWLGIS